MQNIAKFHVNFFFRNKLTTKHILTLEELTKTTNYLKNEFEMKDLDKTKFCLDLKIEHLSNEILVHQSTYLEKVLKHFYMDKTHPLSTPMVGRSLDVKKDLF